MVAVFLNTDINTDTMIKIGDKAYYRYRIGMFNRTKSGTVTAIKAGTATFKTIPYDVEEQVNINLLTANKKQ